MFIDLLVVDEACLCVSDLSPNCFLVHGDNGLLLDAWCLVRVPKRKSSFFRVRASAWEFHIAFERAEKRINNNLEEAITRKTEKNDNTNI